MLPVRKALAIEKDITIVCVGSTDEPADCVACCGTHPSSAGQVGLIKLYKVESNKGMFRIYFDAGQRAFEKMSRQYDTMTQLSNSLSAGDDDIMEKFKSQQEKNREARTQLHLLKKEVIARGGFFHGSFFLRAGSLRMQALKAGCLSENTVCFLRTI